MFIYEIMFCEPLIRVCATLTGPVLFPKVEVLFPHYLDSNNS